MSFVTLSTGERASTLSHSCVYGRPPPPPTRRLRHRHRQRQRPTMKRRHSAIDDNAATATILASASTQKAAPAQSSTPRQRRYHDSDTEVTDVEEHSALEVELDRGDEVLDSLKFVKKDRLRWLTQASVSRPPSGRFKRFEGCC